MSKIKAFIVGVSDYSTLREINLPFCQLDIINFKRAIKIGLDVAEENIVQLGLLQDGKVDFDYFSKELHGFISRLEEHDTAIFYFSGHGTLSNPHYLVLSDEYIKTQDFLDIISQSKAKNKVLFLDCCYSGNFEVTGSSKMEAEESIATFNGTGYAVISSSNAEEPSGGTNNGSIFTNILCGALTNKALSRKGYLSLNDLQLWVKRALEVYSRNTPDYPQHSIFRANMGGTIFFKTSDYTPYQTESFYLENDDYIIHSVEPSHNGQNKRYSAKVILRSILVEEEISKKVLEIKKHLEKADIYRNDEQKARFLGKNINHLFVYIGFSEEDIKNSNFYANATWVDDQQDKKWWYRLGPEDSLINDIHIKINSSYEMIKDLIIRNTVEDAVVIEKLKHTRLEMINIAEKIIFSFNEYHNNIISEDDLFSLVTPLTSQLNKHYFAATEIELPSTKIKHYMDVNLSLLGTIHDFSYFYNEKYRVQRDTKNRKAVMLNTISRYHNDLRELEKAEKALFETEGL